MRTAVLAACVALCVTTAAIADSSPEDEVTAAAAAANRFLETLDPAQDRAAVLPPDSPLIANWSNLPGGMVRFERNGVRAGDLNDAQQSAMYDFLAEALSRRGADLVQEVIAAEGVLADSSRASRLGWHPDNYWLAFFGEPSADRDWSWQFGGHGWPAERQRQLLDLIGVWVGVMPPEAAERRMAEIEAELSDVRFAWNGRTDGSGSIYYRIQGPTLLIEFSTRGSVGAEAGHYHSIYRNRTNEYGRGGAGSTG